MKKFLSLLAAAVVCASLFAFTASAQEAVTQYKENSWRYKDGVQIIDPYALAPMSETVHPDGTLKAIDVSHAQVVDWEKAYATGMFDFAMIRCGFAEDNPEYDDTQWEFNTTECERLGIPYGTYLYSYAETVEDAVSEAQHVLRLVQGKNLNFPIYYDMEDEKLLDKDYAAIAAAFCDTISAAGYPVGVYASLYWWDTYLTDPCFDNWYRWVAQWNESCEYDGRYEMWQFTNFGYIDGIQRFDPQLQQLVQTNVDMNWLVGWPEDHGVPAGPAVTGYIRQDDTQYSGFPRISWPKDKEAVEYQVYRSVNSDSDYKLLRTTTSTAFTNTSAKVGDTYYYKVKTVYKNSRKSDFSNEVKLSMQVQAPQVTASNVAASGKPKLTWDAVNGATEYRVYRSTAKNGTYKKVYTTTGTSYANTSAAVGTRYYYKVVAAGVTAEADSGFSAVVSRTCDLPQPKVTAANVASTGKIKLSWNAVEGAERYEVWRSTTGKSGSYKRISTTANTTVTNTKDIAAGSVYYYKVRALHTNSEANSSYAAVSRTCDLAQPKVTATNVASTGRIKLTWNAVEGAKEYHVYRSATGKEGSYKRISVTAKTTVTNTKDIKAGTQYYYKVRAVHSNSAANSTYATVSRTCDLPQPKAVIALNGNGKPIIAWTAVEGAEKYQVYRSTNKDSGYTRILTTQNLTCTNGKAEAGKTYYYKVRAVHKNTAANSSYSTVVSIKSK